MPTNLSQVLLRLGTRLADYKTRIDDTISPHDEMFRGDEASYLSVTYSGVAAVAAVMALAGKHELGSVLDLPCGHGRVLRGLKAAFPEATFTACDTNRDGVDFCAEHFGARPVYSDPDPTAIPLEGQFDLIFVGSLLTHLDEGRCERFLDFFVEHLAPDGLLLFSTHGRNAVARWGALDGGFVDGIVRGYGAHGHGYRDHPGASGYGTSASKPSWVLDRFFEREDVCVISYTERGFADHQDMTGVLKLDIHHAQDARLNV